MRSALNGSGKSNSLLPGTTRWHASTVRHGARRLESTRSSRISLRNCRGARSRPRAHPRAKSQAVAFVAGRDIDRPLEALSIPSPFNAHQMPPVALELIHKDRVGVV